MSKKNVYFFQPTFMNSTSVHLPYAVGVLTSYAWSHEDICENYEFKECFFLRKNPDEVINEISDPFIVAFSCYMWNFEYNKVMAQKVKEKFPDCVTVFGGPQIPSGHKYLEKYPFIDILIHDEGEVPFRDLLRALNNGTPLSEVNNLSFRQGECFTDTPVKVPVEFDYPSPYKSGFFEKIISENPDIEFIPLIETNRGCPNRCAYCSWGLQNAKIRQHSLQRVYDELEWVSSHKMDFLGFADANFGILPRDEDITDKIIDLYHKTGFPKKFQVSYSKNSSERVFRITEKLNKNNMDKGVTLSFQSMSQNVQKNIGRTNMYIEQFKDLLIKYNKAGIPTYTDLILGLPGETFESFKDGIELLLEYGQHKSLFVHLCEWLPCSEMGKAEYMQKFSLKYKKIPLNQPHTSPDKDDKIQEYSRIITSTYSMTESEWEDTYLFAVTVLGFHHFGLLRYICMYLYNNKQVKYTDFYYEFLKWLLSNDVENAATETIKKIKASIKNVVDKSESVVIFDEKFGNVAWPYEEYLFMNIVPDKEHFYQSIKPFLKRYLNEDIIDELVEYQSFVVKTAERGTKDFYGNYKWKDYFEALNNGEKAELKKAKVHYTIKDECSALTWPEYSKKVVWFGRRVGASIYSTEIEEADNL